MAPSQFTPRERDILSIAWRSIKSKPEFDYAKIAEDAGLKNAASACACLGPILKKLVAGADSFEVMTSPKKRKRASSKVENPKSKKKTVSKRIKEEEEQPDDTADDEDTGDEEADVKSKVKREASSEAEEKPDLSGEL